MNHRFTRVLGERVAAQLVWPGNPVAGHQTLTALFGLLTVRPAGLLHAPLHAPRRVHRAQEEANVLGAHGLYDGVEEGHLHHRFPLTGVPEQVWGDGLIVGQALAHGDCDGLAHLPAGAHAVLEADKGAGDANWKRVDLGGSNSRLRRCLCQTLRTERRPARGSRICSSGIRSPT